MRSVRLSEEMERDLREMAGTAGEAPSQFIRRAIRERCDRLRGLSAAKAFSEIAGSMSVSPRPRRLKRATARDTAELLADAPLRRRAKR